MQKKRTFHELYVLKTVLFWGIIAAGGGGTVPKVACFEIPGLSCWFWSNGRDPPHFHAKKAVEWEIRVRFMLSEDEMFELIWGRVPRGRLLRQKSRAVAANRKELLAEWERNEHA
ncbi:MAG: DUF4160 domain-containing protein [Planctomycetales bacterium]